MDRQGEEEGWKDRVEVQSGKGHEVLSGAELPDSGEGPREDRGVADKEVTGLSRGRRRPPWPIWVVTPAVHSFPAGHSPVWRP